MPRVSKEKNSEYFRKWYAANKKTQIERVKEREAKIRDEINRIKASVGCWECGENHPACLDFHHENSDKELTVAQARQKGWSLERVRKEMDKCTIFCANCHRKKHFG